MKNTSLNCVILGHKDFLENDKLIFLYSAELGKIKVIAKGARKITSKFMGHLETFNFAFVEIYFGPKNIILKEIITTKNYKKIRENLERLSSAMRISEITSKFLYENQKIDNLMELLAEALTQLSISTKPRLTAQTYIIKILDRSGLIPDFKTIDSKLEQKYLKFFHYLKTQSFNEVEKIAMDKNEEQTISKVLEKILSYSLQ